MAEIKLRFLIEIDGKWTKKSKRIPAECYDNRIEWIRQYYYCLGYNVGEIKI